MPDRNLRASGGAWTVGQANVAVNEAAPALGTDGVSIANRTCRFLDVCIPATGTCTAYIATLWLYLGATRAWVAMTVDAIGRATTITSTTGNPAALLGLQLDGAATRFDVVITGIAGGGPLVDWDYRLG